MSASIVTPPVKRYAQEGIDARYRRYQQQE